jgi:DNA-3-methyladenine glycosylase II
MMKTNAPEGALSALDSHLALIISAATERWPCSPTENPIWGLVRIVIAQQVTTKSACSIARTLLADFPGLASAERAEAPTVSDLRKYGVPEKRARCCVEILARAREIQAMVARGASWDAALAGVKGIGPWTISTFRIMVLREPDVLPLGDVGLERAVAKVYGENRDLKQLAEKWKPFRSVACWYLWRTLGNEQLG